MLNISHSNRIENLCEVYFKLSTNQQNEALKQIEAFVIQPTNLKVTFDIAKASEYHLLVVSLILARYISRFQKQKKQSCLYGEEKEQNKNRSFYIEICEHMSHFIWIHKHKTSVANSCGNLIALCLKYCLMREKDLSVFNSLCAKFFPEFKLNTQNLFDPDNNGSFTTPTITTIHQDFEQSTFIVVSLLEKVTLQTSYCSYSLYRENVINFRQKFLYLFLQVGVWYLKVWVANIYQFLGENDQSYKNIKAIVKLLEEIFLYPFEIGSSSQIQSSNTLEVEEEEYNYLVPFPRYFKELLQCQKFMRSMNFLCRWLVLKTQKNCFKQEILSLQRIISKMGGACFSDWPQIRQFRNSISLCVLQFLQAPLVSQQNQIINLLKLCDRVLNYPLSHFYQSLQQIFNKTLLLLRWIIERYPISIQNVDQNVTLLALQICQNMEIILFQQQYEQKSQDTEIRSQELLYQQPRTIIDNTWRMQMQEQIENCPIIFLRRLCCTNQVVQIIESCKFMNYSDEIQRFKSFFKQLAGIGFEINMIAQARITDISDMSNKCQILWTHFLSILLQETGDEKLSENLVTQFLKYYLFAWGNLQGACSLHYCDVFVFKVFENRRSYRDLTNNFWNLLRVQINCSEAALIQMLIDKCLNTQFSNSDALEYLLDILGRLRRILQDLNLPNMNDLKNMFRQVFKNCKTKILENPLYYKLRTKLYQIMWVLQDQTNYIQNMRIIYLELTQSLRYVINLNNLTKYLYDITGIFQAISSEQTFEGLVSFFLKDINHPQVQPLIAENIIDMDTMFGEGLILLGLAIGEKYFNHYQYLQKNEIGYRLHQFFSTIVKNCQGSKSSNVFRLTNYCIKLSPFSPMPPLPYYHIQELESGYEEYQQLVNTYFQNIENVENLYMLYSHAKNELELMEIWFEEAINRKLQLKSLDLKILTNLKFRDDDDITRYNRLLRFILAYDSKLPILLPVSQAKHVKRKVTNDK